MSREEFKVEGEVVRLDNSGKKAKKSEVVHRMAGNWNSKIYVYKCDAMGNLDEST